MRGGGRGADGTCLVGIEMLEEKLRPAGRVVVMGQC